MAEPLGILLLSRSHERVHFGFVLAAAAAALGTPVTIFATNGGLHGICHDWRGLDDTARDGEIQARGVAGLDDLRQACRSLGVRLLACDAGLRAENLTPELLCEDAEIAGVATFLSIATRIIPM